MQIKASGQAYLLQLRLVSAITSHRSLISITNNPTASHNLNKRSRID
jgi:hypothetical protein